MKIATWNVERLKHKNELPQIIDNCKQVKADIFVLTETDSRVKLDYSSCISTTPPEDKTLFYKPTENRVTIYTKYETIKLHETFDEHTAVCAELKTESGALIVYGTIIGVYGNRNENFMQDLLCQVRDIERLAKESNLCVIGDFNCSFADNYYFTIDGRAVLEDVFSRNEMSLITRNKQACIDHIAISQGFITGFVAEVMEWNIEKKLSDHKGIVIELT